MGWKALVAAFVASFVSVSTAEAGLLEFLFGRRDTRPTVTTADQPDVAKPRKTPRKPARQNGLVLLSAPLDMAAERARVIDPKTNPDWPLIDPTLRRGDILVLGDRVVVFEGGRIGDPKSYVALSRSRLVSRQERARIALAARPDPMVVLTAEAGPRQPRTLTSATAVTPPLLGLRGSGS